MKISTCRGSIVGFVCLFSSLVFFDCHQAFALKKAETRQFDVPEGRAIKSLKQAARQAEVKFVFSARVARGVRTRSIRGELIPIEAFRLMLADTSLAVFQHEKSGVYMIRRTAVADSASGDPNPKNTTPMNEKNNRKSSLLKGLLSLALAGLPEATAQNGDSDEVFQLSPFEVTGGSGDSLWSINQSSGGTRIAVAVKELPFSLDVLTTEYMDDFMLSDMAEALPHISNVTSFEPHTGAGSGNPVRGFSQYYQLRDGFYRNGVIGKTLVDRVEVVKGPYAAIYGRGEPGGVVNYIPKRPVFGDDSGKISFQFGENKTYRAQWEQNLALGERTAAFVAGSYFEREFDQIWTHERSRNFGAVISHRFSDRTQMFVEYEHMFRRNNRGRPLADIRIDGFDSDGTRNKYTGEWAWDFYDEYGWVNGYGPGMYNDRGLETINATLMHRFADNVNLRVAVNDSDTTQDYNYYALMGPTIYVDPDTREFTRWVGVPYPQWRQLPADSKAFQADLTVDFNTGDISHTSLLTIDYSDTLQGRYRLRPPRGRSSDVHTVDYGDSIPNYTNDAGSPHGPRTDVYIDYDESINYFDTPEYYTRVDENRTLDYEIGGLFFMHRAKLFDNKLILMAGGRYDDAKTIIVDRLSPDQETITKQTESVVDDFTYNFGANYNLSSRTVLYGSYATSFNPKGDVYSHTLEPMPNEKGVGMEFGFRTSLLEDKMNVGASYYVIDRENVRIGNPDFEPDIDDPNEKPTHIPGGLDRAEGYEFYANGKLNKNFGIRASVGIVDTEHIENIAEWAEGLSFRRVPDWNWSLSSSYRLREGRLKGLSLSASYRANGDHRVQHRTVRSTDLRNNLRTDDAGFLDLSLGYKWKSGDSELEHNARVMVKNALDDIYLIGNGYLSDSRQFHFSYSLSY